MRSLLSITFLFLSSVFISNSNNMFVAGFVMTPTTSSSSSRSQHRVSSLHVSTTTTVSDFSIEIVKGDDRVLDVAAFRNGMTNPEMMVKKAAAKRDAIDTKADALKGLGIGLGVIGPVIGGATFLQTGEIVQAATNYAVLGGGIGGILAVNNFMGKGVHVPDVPEATNRIIVDFSEGLLRNQDVGLIAISDEGTFDATRGVMATVDIQLRNSDQSHPGVRSIKNLPSHYHIKNMEVHKSRRRQGVGQALMDAIVDHAKTISDAKALSLEVEAANPAAVNLYRKQGFEERENPNPLSKNLFMVKMF